MEQTIAALKNILTMKISARSNLDTAIHSLEQRIKDAMAQFPKVNDHVWEERIVTTLHTDGTFWTRPIGACDVHVTSLDNIRCDPPEPAPGPLYKENSVVWSLALEMLFVLTGALTPPKHAGNYYICGDAVFPTNKYEPAGLRTEVTLLPDNTKRYKFNGKQYIWNGGEERVPRGNDIWLDGNGERVWAIDTFGSIPIFEHTILIEVIEVG